MSVNVNYDFRLLSIVQKWIFTMDSLGMSLGDKKDFPAPNLVCIAGE